MSELYQLTEASRNELLALAKSDTITRYNKSVQYKGFSIVDIDTTSIFKTDTITVTCKVGDYYDTVEMQDILIWIQMEAERNENNQINTKAITQALMESIDAMEIKINCTCPDFAYRFAYAASQLDYKYGKPENRPANITNPHNYGSMCFVGDTLVLTEQGLKPIKDIKVGDKVFTHKGRLKEVLANSHHYENKLIKSHIGMEDIISTENHPFYITNKKEISPEWKSLRECKWKDEVVLSPKFSAKYEFDKSIINFNNIEYYITTIDPNKIQDIEGAEVYNLKVADDESYLVTRELYAVHNCKHLIAMLSNKKWLQQVTGTLMDFIEKNIDQVNQYLRPKEGQELTLPNELARQNAKKGFWSKFANRQEQIEEIANDYIEDNSEYIMKADIFNIKNSLQTFIKENFEGAKLQNNEINVIMRIIEKYKEDNTKQNEPEENSDNIENNNDNNGEEENNEDNE